MHPINQPSTSGLAARALRAAGWAAVESMGGQCISFGVFLVMARLLTPADFGTVALANIYVAFSQALIFQGLGQAIIQKAALAREDLEAAFWINLALGIAAAGATLLVCEPVARWFHSPHLADLLRWLSPIFILSALADVQANLLAREFAFKPLAVRTVAAFSCGGAAGIVMARAGFGVWSLAGQQLVVSALNAALLWAASPWRPRLRFSTPHARVMWRFSSRLMGHELVSLASRRSDQFFIGKYMDAAAMGAYAVAARVSTLLSEIVVRSLTRVSLASLARMQTEPQRLGAAFSRILQMQMCLILPLAAGLGVFAREIVLAAVGPQWIAAAPAMRILLLAIPLESLSALNAAAIIARGRPGWVSLLTCYHAALNVALFAVFARWGLTAVAAAYVLRAAILYPVELVWLRRLIPVPIFRLCLSLLPPFLATVVMAGLDILVRASVPPGTPLFLTLFYGLLASVASYSATLAILRRDLLFELWNCLKILRTRAVPA